MNAIVIPPPADTARKSALATLGGIQQYVTVNRFSLCALTRVLMRYGRAAQLYTELEWLVKNGYLVKDSPSSQIYSCTHRGRTYEPAGEPEDQQDGFTIEFVSPADEPEPPAPPSPRRRR